MKPETIKNHIDNNISNMLKSNGYDHTRQHFYNILKNFKSKVPDIEINLESIEKVKDSRQRYSAYYIYYVENRIIDLYKLERKNKFSNSFESFKMLLFKEKLERCEIIPPSYNQKYKDYILRSTKK
jgi:hypothetical protein